MVCSIPLTPATMWWTRRCLSGSLLRSRSSREANSSIPPSGLRISWAMAAAISPMAASRECRAACSFSFLISVMSLRCTMVPMRASSSSFMDETETEMVLDLPFSPRRQVSNSPGAGIPSGESIRKRIGISRTRCFPSASARLMPMVSSASRLIAVTLPLRSATTTPAERLSRMLWRWLLMVV